MTVNIAYELAMMGSKVLVIDLDDQANSSLYLGVNKADEFNKAKSINEFNRILDSFRGRKEVIDFLREDIDAPEFDYREFINENSPFNEFIKQSGTSNGRIDVLPGSYRTKEDEMLTQIAGGGGIKQNRLYRALQRTGISSFYDYVIIDTPPNLTMAGSNGLYASRYLIVPTQLEYFSVFGVRSVIRNIQKTVQFDTDSQRGKVLGIVPMMTEPNNKINKLAGQLLQQVLPPEIEIFPEIKRTTYFAAAVKDRLPISVFAAKKPRNAGQAAMQVSKLAEKLLEKIDREESTRGN
ncbi:MAG: ParA family protein [Elainellaceae cyanobacterium]